MDKRIQTVMFDYFCMTDNRDYCLKQMNRHSNSSSNSDSFWTTLFFWTTMFHYFDHMVTTHFNEFLDTIHEIRGDIDVVGYAWTEINNYKRHTMMFTTRPHIFLADR